MSRGLLDQLADYGVYHDEVQGSIEAADILGHARTDVVATTAVTHRPQPIRAGLLIAVAALVVVLVLVGGVVVLTSGPADEPADQPPATPTTAREPTLTSGTEQNTTQRPVAEGSVRVVNSAIARTDEGIPAGMWAADRIVATNGVVWVGSQDFEGSSPRGALYRLDATTAAITNRIPMSEGVADLLIEGGVLWVLTGAGDLHRVDASSGEITGTVTVDCDVDDCFWYGNSDLLASGDAVRLTSVNNIGDLGQWRIDPATLAIEVVPDLGGVEYDLDDGGSADGVAVDQIVSSGEMWLGEANGLLWSLRSHDGWITGLDLETGERVAYEMHTLAQVDAHESRATLVGDDIWLVPCCSPTLVRFDTATREVSTVAFGGGWHSAMGDGALWIAGRDHIERVDLETGIVTDTLEVEGLEPLSMAADESGAIWISGETVVIRIDPQTRRVSDAIEVDSGGRLLAAHGAVWVATEGGVIYRIDDV